MRCEVPGTRCRSSFVMLAATEMRMVSAGYPAEQPRHPGRRALARGVFHERHTA